MKKIYGYCRISTAKQNIERQERNIKAVYPEAVIVKEVFTGTKYQGRKELESLCLKVKAGDTVVFDSVSRMSRNAEEGYTLYEELYGRGVQLIFLKEPHINTGVFQETIRKQITVQVNTKNQATDRFMNTIIAALNSYTLDLAKEQIRIAFGQAEKEVEDLHQRTREGIETARLHGKRIGQVPGRRLVTQKSIIAKEKIRKYNRSFGGSLTDQETWILVGISKKTYYKYKKELQRLL